MKQVEDSISTALKPFRSRLRREAALHALVRGASCGLLAAFLVEAVMRLTGHAFSLPRLAATAAAAGALAAVLLYALVFRPTDRRTADRVDQVYGLQNRAATMVALAGQEGCMAEAQRQDALAAIRLQDPRELRPRIPRRAALLCLAMAVLCALTALPERLFTGAAVPAQAEESEEARLARELLETARSRILAADISAEEKARLLAELDAAAEGMGDETSLEELAEIMRVSGELEDSLEESAYYVSWLRYMGDSPLFADLCRAVMDEDKERIHLALESMEGKLRMPDSQARIDAIMTYAQEIDLTLEMHEPLDDESYIAVAFYNFSENLKSTTGYVFGKSRSDERIHMAFANFEQELRRALAGVAIWEKAEETEDTLYVQAEDGELPPGETSTEEGEAPEGQQKLLYTDDPDARQGAGNGTRDKQYHTATESIYEPTLDPRQEVYDPMRWRSLWDDDSQTDDGHVAYGSVYGVYYAELLRRLNDGTIPEDAVDAVESYFYGL